MQNIRNGDIVVVYATESSMFHKMRPSDTYANHEIIQCQHFMYFLSKTFGAYYASVTLIRRNRSSVEDEFLARSGGIGGFRVQ